MEYLKDILSGFINICVLIYVAVGLGVLAFLTVLSMIFCWSTTLRTLIAEYYDTASKALKDFI